MIHHPSASLRAGSGTENTEKKQHEYTTDFHESEHFHTWCIGWSTASAVQLRFGNETALAAEVTKTLPQALKRDPRTDGSYARLKACSTHRLYTQM
jgi:hypothetical protein